MRPALLVALACALVLLVACSGGDERGDAAPEAIGAPAAPPTITAELGGEATVTDLSARAFSHPVPGLAFRERVAFEAGDSLFTQNWVQAPASTTARDGLGPLFNARSCSACHSRDGRGQPMDHDRLSDSILFRLSLAGGEPGDGPLPEPTYGGQFNHRATVAGREEGRVSVVYETIHGHFADGQPYELLAPIYTIEAGAYGELDAGVLVSPRVTPQVIGLGLLEAVPEDVILARSDPDDADGDGISGRPNRVWDVAAGAWTLGRFGWKANQPNLRQQIAGAFVGDMGITSPLFPAENHTAIQGGSGLDELPRGGEPELEERHLDQVEFYIQHLAVPAQRDADDPEVRRGYELFVGAGCADCHTPTLHTAEEAVSATLSGQTIHPFTDLLLHDMGPELADDRPDFAADGREWRTPPLWGIGLFETVNGHTRYLHDGRARNLEEAILWHGGEGEASREHYRQLPAADRAALLRFLRSL